MENSKGSDLSITLICIVSMFILVGILKYIEHIKDFKKKSIKKKVLECTYCNDEMYNICEKCKDPICYSHSAITNTGQTICINCKVCLENNKE